MGSEEKSVITRSWMLVPPSVSATTNAPTAVPPANSENRLALAKRFWRNVTDP